MKCGGYSCERMRGGGKRCVAEDGAGSWVTQIQVKEEEEENKEE